MLAFRMLTASAPRIQVFRPSTEEFKNFSEYIAKVESEGANKAGLAKIIPPEGWCPRKKGYDDINLVIPAPISQVVNGQQGLYQQINIQQKSVSVKEFQKMAESNKFKTPNHFDYEDLERKYWKNITFNSPIYGADVSGSLYDDGVEEFNIQHLNTILDMVKQDYEIQIEGVNTAYLYFGMWKTTFAWHTEDMDLYSINYLHFGAPKTWYVVPPEHGRRLERLAAGFFTTSYQSCPAFLRHKMTIISPNILKKYSIPYSKITQEPGEFMITFPFAYHSGFNHGYNCAESTNFALPRWVEYGKRSSPCTCRNDCVKICMDMFVKKFQPDRYELWLAGKDIGAHPEEPNKQYAAPAPKKYELTIYAQKEKRRRAKEMQKIKRHPISKVNKSTQKKLSAKVPKVPISDSDEDTQPYDANEDRSLENPHKKVKVENDEASDSEVCHQEIRDVEEKNQQISFLVDKCSAQFNIVEDKLAIYEHSSIDLSGDSIKSKEPFNSHKTNVISPKLKKTPSVDNPPHLQPFWHSPDKLDHLNPSSINKKQEHLYEKHLELLSKYPNLKEAIHNGMLSVVPITPNSDNKKHSEITFSETSLSESKTVGTTWRCEQTNNGLKIKFVQPKKSKIEKYISSAADLLNQGKAHQSRTSHVDLISLNMQNESISVKNEKSKKVILSSKPTDKSIKKDSIKKDSISPLKIQRANDSQSSWAYPLRGLWQHEMRNFEAEVEFNKKLASIPPHCAVCILFSPIYQKSRFPSEPSKVPANSPVRMPAYCYGSNLNNECILDTNSLLRSDGTAPLLVCANCKVCVHATCYGLGMLPMGSFYCTRCSKQALDAECCLCVLRGGALKPTTDNRWAHIVCATLITESYFESTLYKQPINVSKITPARQRLRCKYCVRSATSLGSKGCCVQCLCGKCYLPYHVTCGYMAGVIFEAHDWPEPIHMICTRHAAARKKVPKRQLTNVSVGERVIAKHKNKRYYWANVKRKHVQEYYSILFEDNSRSTNTLPEDIVSSNVIMSGPPQINEKVKVKWTDEKIYNGVFMGSQSCELYVVEFDDSSTLHQERKQIYAADEKLPKEVQTKMSHSSESRNFDFDTEAEGKRIRTSNQKYNQL